MTDPRRKGKRVELEIVNRHKAIGVPAKRTAPLQASAENGAADVDVYPWGKDAGALVAEVKAKQGDLPKTVIRQLGDNDLLFIKPDRKEPYVFMPWATYERLVQK
ncbi:MAG: hypothetical protein QNJ62_06690 [Methyloceanibacter sp.]|nr:hypothetical protein [Methyloceanibacter sp.]